MFFRAWTFCLVCLLLPLLGGCGALAQQTNTSPLPATEQSGGLLLRTGSIQLGSGLGQNAYSWQGGAGPQF